MSISDEKMREVIAIFEKEIRAYEDTMFDLMLYHETAISQHCSLISLLCTLGAGSYCFWENNCMKHPHISFYLAEAMACCGENPYNQSTTKRPNSV